MTKTPNKINGPDTPHVRPYEPPAILSRERLESAANVCSGAGQKDQPDAPSPGGGLCGQAGLQS